MKNKQSLEMISVIRNTIYLLRDTSEFLKNSFDISTIYSREMTEVTEAVIKALLY